MHFELLSKELAKDPRSHFPRQSTSTVVSPNLGEEARPTFRAGVVGPMSSSSLDMPSVEQDVEERTTRIPAKVCQVCSV